MSSNKKLSCKVCDKNIPFSLALRTIRLCTKPEMRDAILQELRERLLFKYFIVKVLLIVQGAILERSYFPKLIDC